MTSRKLLRLTFLIPIFISCKSVSKEKFKQNLEKKSWEATESGNYTGSIIYYNQLIEIDSSNGAYYFGRGYSFLKLAKIESSLKDFFKAVDLNYRKSGSFYNIGLLNSHVNDSVALIYFGKASQLEPDNLKYKQKYEDCLRRIDEQSKE